MNIPEIDLGARLTRADAPLVGAISSFLIKEGLLNHADVEQAAARQRSEHISFIEALRRMRVVDEHVLRDAVARQFGYLSADQGIQDLSRELVTAFDPGSRNADALRALRTQLSIQGLGESFKLIALAGAGRGAGASYLVANLGVLYAQLGARTLIVDADLRHPRQHAIFGLADGIGLSDWMIESAGPHSIREVMPIPNLHVLRAGTLPPNPQEMLSRRTFRAIAEMLSARYDVVIFDSAPTHLNADAMTVSLVTRACALVARQNVTKLWELRSMSEQLANAGVRIAGSILNSY